MSGGELERGVLGALLLRPEPLGAVDITADDFPPGRLREAFAEISLIYEKLRPSEIDPAILIGRLSGDGAAAFVASLLDGAIKLDPDVLRGRIVELRKRALTSRILMKIERQAKTGVLDLDEIRGDLEAYDFLEGKAFDPLAAMMTGAEMQTLNIQVEWTLDKLIPSRSLTLLHGKGGVGKTWLALAIAQAVSTGTPFLGLPTKKRHVVYIDFENPLPVLKERVCRLDIRDVHFWHLSNQTRPPKLDGPDWTQYKILPSGSFILIDTARSCQSGDENSSEDVAPVMGRLKEIREQDNGILLLHHTPRINPRASKGSTAWEDLADHVLSLHAVRRGTYQEIDDDNIDPQSLLFFGSAGKTRYEHFHTLITRDPVGPGFVLAGDPDATTLDAIAEYIGGPGSGRNQSEIIEWAKEERIGPRMRGVFVALLNRGEREGRWRSRKGLRGARVYEPST